ncbi:DUF3099 domain-containing protein [Microbacterium sp. P02]|uniref:DUF3099 domain-containing protein n=1 Tax=Microbacterium sp. P02 TaxID=3366260 RepID=UPI00366EEF01
MKASAHPQSATSLPRAPKDDASSRSTRYLLMMGIRVLCFVLILVLQPFGWYTWVLAAAAVFLPYFAMVVANVGSDVHDTPVLENPERQLEAAPTTRTAAPATPAPLIIQLHESTPRPPTDAPDTVR